MRKVFGTIAVAMVAALLCTVGAMENEALDLIAGAVLLIVELGIFGISLKLSGAMIAKK